MAFYDYKCNNRFCSSTVTIRENMSEHRLERLTCEQCNGGELEQVIYGVALKFNGHGFYSTDYKPVQSINGSHLTNDSE